MRFRSKFQEGGPMPAEQGGAPQGGADPMAQLIEGAAQAVQTGDCNVAMQVCQMLLELAGGGQGAPAPAPEEAPAEPQEESVYRLGGKLARKIAR